MLNPSDEVTWLYLHALKVQAGQKGALLWSSVCVKTPEGEVSQFWPLRGPFLLSHTRKRGTRVCRIRVFAVLRYAK